MAKVKALGFIMTDRCNAECKICCYLCSPKKNTVLDKEIIKDYIKQAYELKTIQTIAFSGGEAVLYFEQLKECVAYASSYGLKATLVTNGFWAKNEEKGYKMMKELVDAGLTNVSFSVDKFHQEFVTHMTVSKAMRICDRLGVFSAATLMDLADGSSVYEAAENLRAELYNKDLIVYPVFPAGSAADNIPKENIIKECAADEALCVFDQSLSVLFDGRIMMCCSQFSHQIDMAALGESGKTSLKDAISAFNNNDFIYVLLKKQFKWYVEMAKKFNIQLEEKYSISCELCHVLFTNKDFVEFVRPYVKEEANRLHMEGLFGGEK